jgi:thiol-disulfide isomerase/thioredoxin
MKSSTSILLVIAGLVIAITLIVQYTKHTEQNTLQMAGIEGMERYTEENHESKPKVLLFHAPWCGYCKEYLSTKVANGKKNTFETVAGREDMKAIQFEAIDGDANAEMTSQYGIKGFPTIIAVNANGDKMGVFEGDRYDIKQLADFAKSHLLS